MSRARALVAVSAGVAAAALACTRERRDPTLAAEAGRPAGRRASALAPGDAGPPLTSGGAGAGPAADLQGVAYDLSAGKRLYVQLNCVGCHALGGGGIGPALMDATWLYGSEPADVYRSIVEGRPDGMPAFGGRIPERQLWQLVAYVRSLAGLAPKDAAPQRSDHLSAKPPEASTPAAPRGQGR